MKILTFLMYSVFLAFTSIEIFAWGGRGHFTICASAVHLVQEPKLKSYLIDKEHMMGHLCNIPDTLWRALPREVTIVGNSTHYFDPDLVESSLLDIPEEYKNVVQKYAGKKTKVPNSAGRTSQYENHLLENIPRQLGSLWWRADQFHRLAILAGKQVGLEHKKMIDIKPGQLESSDQHPYNIAAHEFLLNLGLMGHFVGDVSVPFHNTFDYNGWYTGQGDIHLFYEDKIVAYLPPALQSLVLHQVKKIPEKILRNIVQSGSIVTMMRTLALYSLQELSTVRELDTPVRPSQITKDGLKIPAVRKPAANEAKKFEQLILRQMARSAFALARMWDVAYIRSGRPDLSLAQNYRFPHTPKFVWPDYLK